MGEDISLANNDSSIVKFADGRITANINSVAEAKIAVKELKLKKKEYSLAKKNIANQQKIIRAEYTNEVRMRGSMVKGGGAFGKIARGFQSVSRDGRKAKLARDLQPLEMKMHEINSTIAAIDSVILQAEAYILNAE